MQVNVNDHPCNNSRKSCFPIQIEIEEMLTSVSEALLRIFNNKLLLKYV